MKTSGSVPLKANSTHSRRVTVGVTGQHRSQEVWELNSILVPTDFSRPSNKALSYAASIAAKIGAQISLLHVIKPSSVGLQSETALLHSDPRLPEADNRMRQLCRKQHVDPHLIRNTLVREGTPHREITDAARELKTDLIIMATQGHTGLAHVLLGSTTESVLRNAPCPVLVVREKEREFIQRRTRAD